MRNLPLILVMSALVTACITNTRAPHLPDGADGADVADGVDGADASGTGTEVDGATGDGETGAETTPLCTTADDCDDHVACTVDTCDPVAGCHHAPADANVACTLSGVSPGCNGLVFQAAPHCDGGGACVADPIDNCATHPVASCQRASCGAETGCGTAPLDNGTACTIADNFSDTCVDGEHHGADVCASGLCQDAASEPCPVGYCELAQCNGVSCGTTDMGHETGFQGTWSMLAYAPDATGSLTLWTGLASVAINGSWSAALAPRGSLAVPPEAVSGTYCVSSSGDVSWRFATTNGPGDLTFRGLVSAGDALGVLWDEEGGAFILLSRVVAIPAASLDAHTFRAIGFEKPGEPFLGTLAVAADGVISGSWVVKGGEVRELVGSAARVGSELLVTLKAGDAKETWRGLTSGSTGVTWLVRRNLDGDDYEMSLLILLDTAMSVPTNAGSLNGDFRFGVFDLAGSPRAAYGDMTFGAERVERLRLFGPGGALWRMPADPLGSFAVASDGGFAVDTVGTGGPGGPGGPGGASERVMHSGQLGLVVATNGAGFFVDVVVTTLSGGAANPVPAGPQFRFGFRQP